MPWSNSFCMPNFNSLDSLKSHSCRIACPQFSLQLSGLHWIDTHKSSWNVCTSKRQQFVNAAQFVSLSESQIISWQEQLVLFESLCESGSGWGVVVVWLILLLCAVRQKVDHKSNLYTQRQPDRQTTSTHTKQLLRSHNFQLNSKL